jgi:hypothetical protein
MAFRLPTKMSVRKLITKALRILRVKRSTEAEVDPSSNPKLLVGKGTMGLSGLGYEMAKQFADDLKAIISRQLIAWVPLSKGYARYKRRMGLDPRTLIATGKYVNSIQPIQQPDGNWLVSVPNTPLGDGSKHTLRDLARWLEYGTRTMPARPHWRPAKNVWRTKMYQLKHRLHFDLVREMKKIGYR